MRLWSLHPKYLDRQGLLAVWREGLLAQKVLSGGTDGYRNHPQLSRFKAQADPMASIGHYLLGVFEEAEQRKYKFTRSKIHSLELQQSISVTIDQLQYEWRHLKSKLQLRSPEHFKAIEHMQPETHPLFKLVPGKIEPWEKIVSSSS